MIFLLSDTATKFWKSIIAVYYRLLSIFGVKVLRCFTAVTYFSSTWRQGGHLIASHVFHCTCRTLYTCPNPPEPIFSQLPNSEQSNVLSSPMSPWGDSRASIPVSGIPPAVGQWVFFVVKGKNKNAATWRNSSELLTSCELFLIPPRYEAPPLLQVPGERCGLTPPWRLPNPEVMKKLLLSAAYTMCCRLFLTNSAVAGM